MALVHMVQPKHREKDTPTTVGAGSAEGPRYPYDLKIRLNNDDIKKLGLPADLKAGGKVVVEAEGYIASHDVDDHHKEGKRRRLEIQITHLEVKEHAKERRERNASAHLSAVGGGKRDNA